jgi:hypothetical protein
VIAHIKSKHEEKNEVLRLRRELLALMVVNIFKILRHTLVKVVGFKIRINLSMFSLFILLCLKCHFSIIMFDGLQSDLFMNLPQTGILKALPWIHDTPRQDPSLWKDPERARTSREEYIIILIHYVRACRHLECLVAYLGLPTLLISLLSVSSGGTSIRVLKVQVLVHDKVLIYAFLSIRACAYVHLPRTPVLCQCCPLQNVVMIREMIHHTLPYMHCLPPMIQGHIQLLLLIFWPPRSIPDLHVGWDRMSCLPPYLLRDQSTHRFVYFLYHNNIVL